MTNPDLKSLPKQFLLGYANALGCDLGLSKRDLSTLKARVDSEGYEFLTRTLPLLGKALERGIADRQLVLPSNFKKKFRSGQIPAFCGSLFSRVFDRSGALLDGFCVYAVYQIRQVCYMVNKVDLPCKPQLSDKVIAGFITTEEEMHTYNSKKLSFEDEKVMSACNLIIRSLFSDFDFDTIEPSSGPGVTSNVDFTRKGEYQLSPGVRVESVGHHYWFNDSDAMTRLDRYPVWSHQDYFRANLKARVILVPKDSRGPRLISCEPQENMFLQQGIMKYIVERLESSPLTRGQINFTDQSVNQRLAALGSIDGSWSTLDLKDASDRVSLKLVTKIFSGSPIFPALLETRTPITVLPDGREVRLSKFAPMGSALCFPVMATCIYALACSALLSEGCTYPFDKVYVYGDDIIVPTNYAHGVIRMLERFALRVNDSKSFINSYFAESCGYDAVKGNDVTPVRLRTCLVEKEPTSIASTVATANQLKYAGCDRAAEYLYSAAERHVGRLPYGSSRSPYLSRIWTGDPSLIPEANWLERRTRWKKETDLIRYPLGYSLRALSLSSGIQAGSETLYGRLSRIWKQLGVFDAKLPKIGEFSRPRSAVFRRSTYDHYAMA